MSRARTILFYVGYVLGWTLAITAGAALAGAILFPLFGCFFTASAGFGELALLGASMLGQLAGEVWALPIAIVLAVRRAYLRHQASSTPRS